MRRASFLTAAAALCVSTPALADAVFFEEDFMAWTSTAVPGGDGGSGSSEGTAQTTGGNPGGFFRVAQVGSSGTIFGYHLDPANTYSPAAEGAIEGVDFLVDRRAISAGGDGMSFAVLLEQDGVFYLAQSMVTGTSVQWVTTFRRDLDASEFNGIVDGQVMTSLNPDFSAAGAPITFGLFTANTISSATVGYDNWQVIVRSGVDAGCAADLSGDGVVGSEDLGALLAAWGSCP